MSTINAFVFFFAFCLVFFQGLFLLTTIAFLKGPSDRSLCSFARTAYSAHPPHNATPAPFTGPCSLRLLSHKTLKIYESSVFILKSRFFTRTNTILVTTRNTPLAYLSIFVKNNQKYRAVPLERTR